MRLLNGPAPLGDVNSIVAAMVHFVGNTMIDTQERRVPQARGGEVLEHIRLRVQGYGLGHGTLPHPCARPELLRGRL